jgi:hypothetical protein
MSREKINEAFSTIWSSMTCDEVIRRIGTPDSQEEGIAQNSSGWGYQEDSPIWRQIKAGEQYMQWKYCDANTEFSVWFSRVNNEWQVACRTSVPRSIQSENARSQGPSI